MRHSLRIYQLRAVDRVIASLARNPILVAPTGSGKTVMGTALVERVSKPTLWIAHRKELIVQAAERLRAHGLDTGIIMSGFEPTDARVQVASVQTLARRQVPECGMIVVDEAHHVIAGQYRQVMNLGLPVVGLTATPFRLDGCGLGDAGFGEIIVACTSDALIQCGVLHQPRVFASAAPDLRGVKMTAGDYNLEMLAERANTKEQVADIVNQWKKHAGGKKTVAFAVNIAHSKSIVEAFVESGIAAEHLDGTTPREQRDDILARLRSGQTTIVSNCMVLTEGWDLPALECAIIARPTASLNLHLQMIGRIMRVSDGKIGAIVLDHAGNTHVHGLVTRKIEYSLDSQHRAGKSDPVNVKRCPNCGLIVNKSDIRCTNCDFLFETTQEIPEIHGDGELHEIKDDFGYRRHVWQSIESQRMAYGYRPGWSIFRYRDQFGKDPVVVDGDLVNPINATRQQRRSIYERFLQIARDKGLKDGFASHRYREIFGVWPSGFVADAKLSILARRLCAAQP